MRLFLFFPKRSVGGRYVPLLQTEQQEADRRGEVHVVGYGERAVVHQFRIGAAYAHVVFGALPEEGVDVFEAGAAAGEDEARTELVGIARLLDLFHYVLHDIQQSCLDDLGEVVERYLLVFALGAPLDFDALRPFLLRYLGRYGVSVGGLQLLDEALRNRDGTDVAVDGVRADGQYAHVAHDVVLPDADVRAACADVDHCRAEFLFVFGQYGGCARLCVGEKPALTDAQSQEGFVEPFETTAVGEGEVEGGFELLAETSHGLHRLLARVDDVFLRRTVENADPFGRLEAVHALVELGDILLAYFVVFAADVDEIGAVGALDVVAGDACIGFRHLDAEVLFQFRYRGTDRSGDLFDVDDLAA